MFNYSSSLTRASNTLKLMEAYTGASSPGVCNRPRPVGPTNLNNLCERLTTGLLLKEDVGYKSKKECHVLIHRIVKAHALPYNNNTTPMVGVSY